MQPRTLAACCTQATAASDTACEAEQPAGCVCGSIGIGGGGAAAAPAAATQSISQIDLLTLLSAATSL
jgi:hypothetical protein